MFEDGLPRPVNLRACASRCDYIPPGTSVTARISVLFIHQVPKFSAELPNIVSSEVFACRKKGTESLSRSVRCTQ